MARTGPRKRAEAPKINRRKTGLRIRQARKGYGWSVEGLATVTGLKPGAISFYECGLRLPNPEALAVLSVALRRTVGFLLIGQGEGKGRERNRP